MPVISTNDIDLHKKLKHAAITNDLTVGEAVEKAVRFALEVRLFGKEQEDIKQLLTRIKNELSTG